MELNGLFLGLGNPGPSYVHTRHNFGFMLADVLVEACRASGEAILLSGKKDKYEAWRCRLPSPDKGGANGTWIVAKPLTFMNKSGEAAVHLLNYYRIPTATLFVAHDELDLPLGSIRLKFGGSAAGHNGIKSICELTGTQDFYRMRMGVGKPAGYDMVSYVLGAFSKEEETLVTKAITAGLAGFFLFCRSGLKAAQQEIHSFRIDSTKS